MIFNALGQPIYDAQQLRTSNAMNLITYLFGAGASMEALPLVHEIPAKIGQMIAVLESPEFQLDKDSIISDGKAPLVN